MDWLSRDELIFLAIVLGLIFGVGSAPALVRRVLSR
jgi:hypothetical protein